MLLSIKIAKLNSVVDFDLAKLPDESKAYLFNYGLVQAMNDAHASVQRKNCKSDAEYIEQVRAKVLKREAQIRSGDVPGSRAPADPKAAEARAIAKVVQEHGLTMEQVRALVAAEAKKKQKAA